MKKTLAAVAVLGAFAGSAMAADVTLYGVVDEALVYTHTKVTNKDATNKFELAGGKQAGNRFGLKGVEDLGNGVKVGFILENGYNSDDGSLSKYGDGQEQNRIFGREAVLFVEGGFGRLTAGRTGQLTSGNGSCGIAGAMNPFGTATYGLNQQASVMVGFDRIDNSLTYSTPSFAGFKVYAQASLKNDNNTTNSDGNTGAAKADEGKHTADRYYAIGATYKNAGLDLALVFDTYDYGHSAAAAKDDGYTVTFGGSYNFEVVKVFFGAQYFDDIQQTNKAYSFANAAKVGQMEGYALTAGVDVPVLGGNFKFDASYGDAENVKDSKWEAKRYGADVGYVYPFSKRTSLYATAGYQETKLTNGSTTKTKTTQAMVGLTHKF